MLAAERQALRENHSRLVDLASSEGHKPKVGEGLRRIAPVFNCPETGQRLLERRLRLHIVALPIGDGAEAVQGKSQQPTISDCPEECGCLLQGTLGGQIMAPGSLDPAQVSESHGQAPGVVQLATKGDALFGKMPCSLVVVVDSQAKERQSAAETSVVSQIASNRNALI